MASKSKKDAAPAVEEQPVEALATTPVTSEALAVSEDDEWDYGDDANKGFQGLSRDEFAIPFYGLLQSNSELVKQNKIPGARGGLFLNSMTGELIEKLIVQPVHVERVIVEWAPRGSDKKIVARYQYADPIVQEAIARNGGSIIGTKEKPLKHGDNFLVDTRYLYFNRLLEDGLTVSGFGIMPFAKTKITPLVNATSAVAQAGMSSPTWGGRFVMTAELKHKAGESWHNVIIVAFGKNNLMFDKTNLLPPPPRNPDAEWSAKHVLYQKGKDLEASITSGQRKADFAAEEHFSGEGGGAENVDSAGASRHF